MKRVYALIAMVAAIIGAAVSPALATPTLGTFDLASTAAQCGASHLCGTVTLSEFTSTDLRVTINLSTTTGIEFAKTGAGDMVDFNVTGATLADITLSFSADPILSQVGSGFAITCSSCHGTSDHLSTLTFDVIDSAGLQNLNLVITELDVGGPGCFPSSQSCTTTPISITSQTCAPDTVCTQGNPTPIPEPLTIALFGAGLAGLGAARRRKTT